MTKSDPQSAAVDIAKALKSVFQKYSYQTRRKVWDGLSKGQGKKAIDDLLIHPAEKHISDFHGLRFRDWIKSSQKK